MTIAKDRTELRSLDDWERLASPKKPEHSSALRSGTADVRMPSGDAGGLR